jgi:Flp pilus assembly protein TadD/cell division protein FtsN
MRAIKTILAIIWAILFLVSSNAAADDEDMFKKGLQLMDQQRYDEAINAFSKAIEIIPADFQAYNSRGVAWALKGDFARAIDDYNKALELRPHYAEAFNNRGYAHTQRGELKAALDDYRKALEIDPFFVDAYNNTAWILATTDDTHLRNSAQAIALAQKAVELEPKIASLDTLAAAYAAAGNYEAAIETQKKVIQKLIKADQTSEVPIYMTHLNAYRSQQSLRISYAAAHKPSKAQPSKSALKTKTLSPSAPPPETVKTVKAPETRPVVAAAKTKTTKPLSLKPTSTPLPYTIQVSAFRNSQTSNQVAAKLRTRGDRAFTCPVEIPDKGKWNRVYIGHYKTYEEAKAAATGLKKRNFRYVHVTKTPYAVEVGLVGSEQQAQNLKSRLREKGYLGYTLAAKSGQNQIRILVGAYENKSAAEELANQLKNDGFNPKIDLR